ncbi:MAG: glycoside hydrolase family protein [Bacteroidota bacterium]
MNKIIGILFVFTAFFWSCEDKFLEGEFRFYEIEEPESNKMPALPEIGKKGFGKTIQGTNWSFMVSDLNPHWHYSWGSKLSEFEPVNVDFVPMIWGYYGINEEKVADLKALKEEGKIRYLLGFNEPDKADQSNMTVDQAIEKWPMLEEVGVPLGSPAPANPTGEWLQEFMQRAEDEDLRVDFVCVHWYGGTNVQNFLNKLEEVYNLYGKPIWITEFAPADWDANSPAENKHSTEEVLTFMENALPELENLDYVDRYAWFSFSQNSAAGTSSALFDTDGNLTELGTFYANFEPNIYIGEGQEVTDGPVVVFHEDFETGNLNGWENHASNGMVQGAADMNDPSQIIEGDYSYFKNWGSGDMISRVIDLEPGVEYTLSFDYFMAWDWIYINVYIYDASNDELIAETNVHMIDPGTGSVDFTAPEGGSVKILFNKWADSPGRVGIDNIMIVEKSYAFKEDFETGDLNGWENHASNGMVQGAADMNDPSQIIEGDYSYFKNWGNGDMISRVIELEPGVEYTLSFDYFMAWDWIYINVYIYNASNNELIAETNVHMIDPGTGSVNFTAPEGGSVKILFNKWADSPGRVGIDNIVIEKVQ